MFSAKLMKRKQLATTFQYLGTAPSQHRDGFLIRVNRVASLFLVGRAHWFAWIRQKKKKKKMAARPARSTLSRSLALRRRQLVPCSMCSCCECCTVYRLYQCGSRSPALHSTLAAIVDERRPTLVKLYQGQKESFFASANSVSGHVRVLCG